jgi:predicted nucleic acid-binding protein
MIHLDANYLILSTVGSAPQALEIRRWLAEGEDLGASAIAWMEFVTGPVAPELISGVSQVIDDRVVPLGREEAELAAELFNTVGRKRSLRYDCMIAAVAIHAGAKLATANRSDFAGFAPHGLVFA